VAATDRRIPVREDHHRGAFDLKKIGRVRLTGTLHLSGSIRSTGSCLNGQD
jgi:hypothetical protein